MMGTNNLIRDASLSDHAGRFFSRSRVQVYSFDLGDVPTLQFEHGLHESVRSVVSVPTHTYTRLQN